MTIHLCVLYVRIGYNPFQIPIDTCVDPWTSRLTATQTPRDNANGDPALIGQLHHQRATAITLTTILATLRQPSTDGSIRYVLHHGSLAIILFPNGQICLLKIKISFTSI